jgi:hypothetical protein
MGADKNSSRRRWRLQQDELHFQQRLRLTTQVGQAHVATGVPLDLGTNKQPSEPKHTNTHRGNLHGLLPVPHRSDRWSAPVRPVDSAGQAGGYSSRTTSVPECLSDFCRPWNKTTPKTQPAQRENPTQDLTKHLQTDQELTSSTKTQRHTSPVAHQRQIPQKTCTGQTGQEHRSDRCSLGSSGWTAPAGQRPQIQTSISWIAPRTWARLWGW